MKRLILILLMGLFVSGAYVHADDLSTGSKPADISTASKPVQIVKLDNPIKATSIKDLLFSIVDLFIFLGTIVAVFMFLYIGFKFVMAQGNSKEIDAAKEWFKWAVVGTAILISSKVIVSVVENTLVSAGVVDKSVFNQTR